MKKFFGFFLKFVFLISSLKICHGQIFKEEENYYVYTQVQENLRKISPSGFASDFACPHGPDGFPGPMVHSTRPKCNVAQAIAEITQELKKHKSPIDPKMTRGWPGPKPEEKIWTADELKDLEKCDFSKEMVEKILEEFPKKNCPKNLRGHGGVPGLRKIN